MSVSCITMALPGAAPHCMQLPALHHLSLQLPLMTAVRDTSQVDAAITSLLSCLNLPDLALNTLALPASPTCRPVMQGHCPARHHQRRQLRQLPPGAVPSRAPTC